MGQRDVFWTVHLRDKAETETLLGGTNVALCVTGNGLPFSYGIIRFDSTLGTFQELCTRQRERVGGGAMPEVMEMRTGSAK